MSFLYGKELQKTIKRYLSSKTVKRCAVAFVGRGTADIINGKCEILCDLFSSGTNPYEIQRLCRLKNVTLRHMDNLHVKIYKTDNFVIVGSANLTNHALNFDGTDNTLIEACVKFTKEKMPKHYEEINDFVDLLWTNGVPVTSKMVNKAINSYKNREKDKAMNYTNIVDFCGKHYYVCIYTDPKLTEKGEAVANSHLNSNWKDYYVWENWKALPVGIHFSMYWNPKNGKIQFEKGVSEYNGYQIDFKYEENKDCDNNNGSIQIAKKIKVSKAEMVKLKSLFEEQIIPLVLKKYSFEYVQEHDDGVVFSFDELLDN